MTPRFLSLLLALLLLPAASHAQSLLLDNFNYAAGTALTANGWTQVGTVATNPILVTTPGLTFPNYPGASGNATTLTTGQDVFRTLTTARTTGSVYAAFTVSVAATATAGDYFFALTPTTSQTTLVGRVYARYTGTGVQFGLSKTNNTPLNTAATYAAGTTYLLVLRYDFVSGTANDPVSLYVLSANDPIATEPATPTLADPTTTSDLTEAGTALLRQGGANTAPTVTVDGIRIGTSWNEAVLATQSAGDGEGYRLLGAPVQNVTVGTLAGINLVQGVVGQYPTAGTNLFLGTTGAGTSASYVAATNVTNPVLQGLGFAWYLYDRDITPQPASFGGGTSRSYVVPERPLFASGPVLTTDLSVGFPLHTDGFYLLANPFAQPFAASGVTQAGGTTFSNFVQVYDPVGGFSPVSRFSTNLSMWQGFFAEVTSGAAPTFTYAAASRNDGTIPAPPRAAAQTGLALTLDGTTAMGATRDAAAIVRFDAAASAGWDADDASKLTPPTQTYALVAPVGTRDGAARRQAVLSLPETADVTLAFTTTHAGTFTLTADATGLPAGATVRDLVTGNRASLADGLTFTADATDWTERFVVSFGRTTAGEQAAAGFALGAVFPNPAAASARVALRVDAAQAVTATVVDALGRTVATVFEGALSAGQSQDIAVDTARLAPGVYVVRIAGETFSATRRLVVAR